MKRLPTVLTIAGSDPSGGAGIQADLKTIAAHELAGLSVITSLTVQNTQAVQERHDVAPEVVAAQLASLLADGKPAAVKTGMLGNDRLVATVARMLRRARVRNLVVDPVIRPTRGRALLSREGVRVLQEKLLPLATVVTPNLREAEALSGVKIRKKADRARAARALVKKGARAVLITGGHGRGRAEDLFYDGKKLVTLDAPRLGQEALHGTGCVLSAAIASNLALGASLPEAVEEAKEFISEAIDLGVRTGAGAGQVQPLGGLYRDAERWLLLERMHQVVEFLKVQPIGELIPEVQSNMGFALEAARGPEDVAAVPGRILRDGEGIATLHEPRFGASRHVARIVLTAMQADPGMRAAMNIRFQQSILDACKRLGMTLGTFDRSREPKNVKQFEGSSLEWGTHQAIRKCGFVPDVIYDLGGQGKEEMIRVLARDVEELLIKILKIHHAVVRSAARRERESWRKR